MKLRVLQSSAPRMGMNGALVAHSRSQCLGLWRGSHSYQACAIRVRPSRQLTASQWWQHGAESRAEDCSGTYTLSYRLATFLNVHLITIQLEERATATALPIFCVRDVAASLQFSSTSPQLPFETLSNFSVYL